MNKEENIFKYDHCALSEENLLRFKYSNIELDLYNDLKNIVSYSKGIYVLAGERGCGKTSLVKKVLLDVDNNNYNKNKVIVELNVVHLEKYIYVEMLEKLLESNISEIYKAKIRAIIELFDKDHKSIESKTKSKSELDVVETEKSVGMCFKESLKFGFSKNSNNSSSSGYSFIEDKSKEVTFAERIKRLFELFEDINKEYDIILVIDELDKLSSDEIGVFIEHNKLILLNNILTTLLLCGRSNSLYLEMHHNHYISDYIYYNNLSFNDFFIKINSMEICVGLVDAIQSFYITLGNQREIIKEYYGSRFVTDIKNKAILLYFFTKTDFYIDLNDKYKDIVLLFIKEMIETIFLVDHFSLDDAKVLANNFNERLFANNYGIYLLLNNTISFLKEEFIFDNLITYSYCCYENNYLKKYVISILEVKCKIFNFENNCFSKDKIEKYIREIIMIESGIYDDKNNYINYVKLIEERILKDNNVEYFFGIKIDDIKIINHYYFDSTVGAIDRLKRNHSDIVGVILFEPYSRFTDDNNYKPLYNGYIIIDNGLDKFILSYTGSPGLSSHKKHHMKELYSYVRKNNIKTLLFKNNEEDLKKWDMFFDQNLNEYNSIDDLIKVHFLSYWIKMLKELYMYEEIRSESERIEVIQK